MRTPTRLIAALGLGLTIVVTALLPATPAPAAPPPAAHSQVVSTDPSNTTPHVLDGRTETVLDLGSRVIVGGTFTKVKNFNQAGEIARSYLFAYDKATGAIDTQFAPQPNGRVNTLLLAADGNVLVGGQFSTIAGQSLPYLAKLNGTTGAAVTAFAPRPDGMVYDMHLANGHLYVGGTFTRVGSTVRTNFAVLNPNSGAPRSGADVAFTAAPAGATRLMRFDITPDGRKLVGIGNFARVAGQDRPNAVVLDLTSGGGATVNGWRTDQYRYQVCGGSWDTITYDVDLSPDGSYFVIVTTGGPRGTTTLCDTATRWETSQTGAASPTWRNYTGGDSLTSVAVTGAAVYVAGHHRWLDNPEGHDSAGPGAVERTGIGALDPTTGRALSWNPGRERGLVTPRLVPTSRGLYVLSDSSEIGGEWHPRLAFLPLPGTTPPPVDPPPATAPSAPGTPAVTAAGADTVRLSWSAPSSPGTSAIAGYRITVRTISGTVAGTVEKGTNLTGSVSGLTPGQAYRFSIAARNGSGYGPESALSAPALPPFATLDAFTDRQYRDATGKAATAAQLSSWRAALTNGTAPPGGLVDSLLDGQATVASVSRLYSAYFLRLPDTSGLDYWVGRVRRGTSLRAAAQFFSTSGEFKQRYGRLSDRDFVRLVYRNVLTREPDAAGLSYWVGQLAKGASRGSVMVGFSESPEYGQRTRAVTEVVTTYQAMLRRVPTAAERATWEPLLKGSTPRAELAAAILALPAYDARV